MNAFQRKVALRVLGIHVAFILVLVIFSGLKGCFRPKPKPEIMTFIDFGPAAPPVAVEQVDQMTEPEPPAPEPEPVKVPDPVRIPEKPKKVIKPPKKIEQPKPKPVKPKWTPTKASDIDPTKSKKIEPKPVKPSIDPSKIKLGGVQEQSAKPSPGPVGNPNADAAYISQITSFFDRRWNHPANASPSSSVIVRIYISKWGTITKRQKIQGSGDAAFDQSVMAVVNSEKTVAKPPANYSYEYVEVEFRIRN